SPPEEQEFKKEQCFVEDTSTEEIRQHKVHKTKYEEQVQRTLAAEAPRMCKSNSSPSKTPRKRSKTPAAQHPYNGACGGLFIGKTPKPYPTDGSPISWRGISPQPMVSTLPPLGAEHPTSAKRREITPYSINISFIPLHAELVSMEGFLKKS
ncbi:hypothetical protein Taro_003084, partial [Colocasia esculenta]|nr:hypothetical protein [Colocasia esculenta]